MRRACRDAWGRAIRAQRQRACHAPPRRARGLVLLEIVIGMALLTMASGWLAARYVAALDDAAAMATGRYLLTVRGAVQALTSEHFGQLTGVPVAAGAADEVPLPAWLVAGPVVDVAASLLREPRAPGQAGFLAAGFPANPPLGGEARIRIAQVGTCPGADCRLESLVYTRDPIRTPGQTGYDASLLGQVMLATEGYGGNAREPEPGRLRGPLFDQPNPQGAVPGIAAVTASLEATLFNQFVRQGDTRPVWLRNTLSVAGEVQTEAGLVLATAVVPGSACAVERAYASSAHHTLAVCRGGLWFELTRYVVTWRAAALADGAQIPAPACPVGASAFVQVALRDVDVDMRGADVQVRGALNGTVTGTGAVSSTGAVSVAGQVQGTLSSTPDSYVRVRQHAQALGSGPWTVRIEGAQSGARASAVVGCQLGG